jgi:hypothetical protein
MTPEPQRMIARYQQELAEANDRAVRYASLADALADQVQMLQDELRRCKEESAAPVDGKAPPATGSKVSKE